MKGEIRFYDPIRCYGYLFNELGEWPIRSSGPTRNPPSAGDLVEFSLAQSDRGPGVVAVDVMILFSRRKQRWTRYAKRRQSESAAAD